MEIEVFECVSGVSKSGRAYNIILAKVDGKVGKLFSDVALPTGKVTVEMVMSVDKELKLAPAIKSIVSK